MISANFQQLANFIWLVADLLRGPYRPPQYERVMLPLTVLRRFDAALAPSKGIPNIDAILNNLAKDEDGRPLGFHNHSQLDFPKLKGDPDNIGRHLADYIAGFSENIRKIFERFEFDKEIEKLEESNRLYQVVAQFAEIDLHPRRVDNITMGLVFEDLIRRFNEAANETVGDHFTPREVIQLMVNLLLEPDTGVLTQAGVIVTICDPACGTGGMLAEAQNWIRAHNAQATVKVFGQDYNPRSYAVAASDLLIKGHKDGQVVLGNTLTDDPFPDQRFDYLLANPPFGVDWKAEKKIIDRWPNFRGYSGKLPRINDGALLFLLYMMSKFQDYKAGERDQLEAIVALPEQMFYNTGIGTFIWVVTNRKASTRRGKIQLINARERFINTCPELYDALQAVQDALDSEPLLDWNQTWDTVQQVFKTLPDNVEGWAKGAKGTAQKKIFRDCFTVVDPEAAPVIAKRHKKGDVSVSAEWFPQQTLPPMDAGELYALLGLHTEGRALVEYEPDLALKDFENIPLKENIVSYVLREVRPYVPDAWIDRETLDEQDGGIGKVGYEINFNRVFFQYQPPRPLAEIDAELADVEKRILELLREVAE